MIKVVMMIENFSIGGAQNMLYNLIKEIDRNEFEPHVICYRSQAKTELENRVCEICDVTFLNIKGRVSVRDVFMILKTIKKFSPDIVHGHLSAQKYVILYSLIFRIPFVITAHTKPQVAFEKSTEKLLKLLVEKDRGVLVAVSDANRVMCDEYFGFDKAKSFFINNGVDIEKFYKVNHKDFTFINVGRQDENKNQKLIITCFARLIKEFDDSKLILVGDGPCHGQLMQYVAELDIENNVIFTGSIFNVEDYYAVADVYLQSSHREAMPMTALEAMSAGLPILSTAVGGMKDIVDENGYLVKDGDEKHYYEVMKKYITMDLKELKKQGDLSRQIVENGYSVKMMAEKYGKIYKILKNW